MKQEELKELMALLPSNIKTTKEFTTKTKMVIAQLILMNGLDKVKNDGYFFVTNQKLVEELGITEKTIIKIMRNLETNNFITRKSGKRGEASEYIVNEEIIKSFGNTVKKHCNTVKENTVINYSNNLESTVLNYSNKINDLVLIINDLVKSNQELINKVNQLEITVLNYSNKIQNYSTDTESDTETDIEKELEIYNNIIIENINNKKEYIIEEIEVVETSISENEKNEIYEIEEVGLIENPTSNEIEEINPMSNGNGSDDEDEVLDMIFGEKIIEENNNTFQHIEVGMLEEKNDMIETTKKIFYEYLNNFGNGITNMEELTNRAVKFNGWLERQYQADNITYNEYSSMIEECRDKFTSIQQDIQHQNEEKINELQDEFLKSVLLDSKEAKTVNQINEEKNVETSSIKTKEELIKNLQVFKDSLTNYDNLEDAKHQLHSYCDINDKLIREYELTSMVGKILSEIDNIKNANKSDLTDFNNQDIETITNDEKTQEIASCEVMDECANIEDCIASLIEDLEPAVLDSNETYIFETSTKLW